MRVLAIETSCDETAVAILEIEKPLEKPKVKVLGNSLLSQVELHKEYGGVYPNLAKREHEKNLPILLSRTLKEVGVSQDDPNLDLIAVTEGPGLEPALWTGINFALELGRKWSKRKFTPVIPVNHMEGHIFSTLFDLPEKESLALPALALLVSGGHTELVLVKDFGDYEVIGRTRDDAVGEAFDKVARMLGLPYPGGPEISKQAEISRQERAQIDLTFPQPMLHSKNLDFSFSGLKTAVLYKLKSENRPDTDIEFKKEVARAFEDAAIGILIEKTRSAFLELRDKTRTLIVAGGVSANLYLRRELEKLAQELQEVRLHLPVRSLTTDNALMIAMAAFIKTSREPDLLQRQTPIQARGNLDL